MGPPRGPADAQAGVTRSARGPRPDMLSRVAENLYWMSRIHRTWSENLARLLGVGFDLELDAAGLARDLSWAWPRSSAS